MDIENQGPSDGMQFTDDQIAFQIIGDYPDAPTLIFLHDSLGCISLWRDFPRRLGALTQCNVLVYDRQGYGRSCPFSNRERENDYMEIEADHLNDLMAHWKISKAILFGHSDGGSIALIMAAKYPEKVLGIISEGAHVFVEELTLNGIRDAIQLYESSNLKDRLAKYHGGKTEAMFWAWAATWTTNGFKDWNIETFLPMIQCPVLVVQGLEDEYGTLEQVESIVGNTNGKAIKLLVPNCRHTPHKEVPEFILDHSSQFVNQLQ